MASDKKNFVMIDKYGNEWYGKMLPDGKQIWATVQNNTIRNGGINDIPKVANKNTGFCKE